MALPFNHVGLWNPTQLIRTSDSCLYVPNHFLLGPYNSFFWKSGRNIEIHTFNVNFCLHLKKCVQFFLLYKGYNRYEYFLVFKYALNLKTDLANLNIYFYFCVYFMWVQVPTEGGRWLGTPAAGVIGLSELHNIGARNWALIFWQRIECSKPLRSLQPPATNLFFTLWTCFPTVLCKVYFCECSEAMSMVDQNYFPIPVCSWV